jgi:hypothetical protein
MRGSLRTPVQKAKFQTLNRAHLRKVAIHVKGRIKAAGETRALPIC